MIILMDSIENSRLLTNPTLLGFTSPSGSGAYYQVASRQRGCRSGVYGQAGMHMLALWAACAEHPRAIPPKEARSDLPQALACHRAAARGAVARVGALRCMGAAAEVDGPAAEDGGWSSARYCSCGDMCANACRNLAELVELLLRHRGAQLGLSRLDRRLGWLHRADRSELYSDCLAVR